MQSQFRSRTLTQALKAAFHQSLPFLPIFADIINVGLIVCIGFFALSQDVFEPRDAGILFISLFSVLAFRNVAETYSKYRTGADEQENLKRQISTLSNEIRGTSSITLIGRADKAIAKIQGDLERASEIKNTDLFFKIDRKIIGDDEKGARSPIDAYMTLGKKWTDIISPNLLEKVNAHLADRQISSAANSDLRYRLLVTCRSYPAINFVLLTFSDQNGIETNRVYFGWGRHDEEPNGHVFSSEHPELIAMFSSYWRSLYNDALPYDEFVQRFELHEAVLGVWANASWSEIGENNFATMVIREDEAGRLLIEGTIYVADRKGGFERIGSFRSTSARLASRRLYFSYERSTAGNTKLGHISSIDGSASSALMVLTLDADGNGMKGFAVIGEPLARVEILSRRLAVKRAVLHPSAVEYEEISRHAFLEMREEVKRAVSDA